MDVVDSAPVDSKPTRLPYDAKHKYVVQVPPYPRPLATAPDARGWWTEHRPLVLQTAALGPLENTRCRFSGFRVLSVKADVIDKIHFVPTQRLHENGYRLSWEEAIKPEPPWHYPASLHVCGVSSDGNIWHAVRRASGSWIGFGDVKTVAGQGCPGVFTSVACAGIVGDLHVCGVSGDGRIWHAVRRADGSWMGSATSRPPPVNTQASSPRSPARPASGKTCTCAG